MALASFPQHPFLRGLSEPQLQSLLPCASEVRFERDAFIFREGEPAESLYLLTAGCVALEQHVPGRGIVTLENLCAGDLLGLSWLFPAALWMLDARCTEPVRAIALPAACVQDRMQRDAALGVELLTHVVQALYQRLVRVRLQRLDVYSTGAP